MKKLNAAERAAQLARFQAKKKSAQSLSVGIAGYDRALRERYPTLSYKEYARVQDRLIEKGLRK